ncbi:MAG: MarR family transcriptional regulator [Phycisphaerae bacterium]|nr:MarR family transcriptional regulator [Phycisphaerae bacterium]
MARRATDSRGIEQRGEGRGVEARPAERAGLGEAQDRFVAAWGQMGAAWGISRTMAEVHALLYITGAPMNADEIMDRLRISRGNASMSLRALVDWGIVSRTLRRGDRREYFRAEQDVWAMVRAIVRERMKREMDPVLATLYEVRDLTALERRRAVSPETRRAILEHNRRIDAMLDLFRTMEALSDRFVSPAGRGLRLAASVLGKVRPA